jgi:hypothetical protein
VILADGRIEVQQEENAEASLMEGNQPSSIAGPSTVANQQASGSGAVKRKYVVDQADIEAVKKVCSFPPSASLLLGISLR